MGLLDWIFGKKETAKPQPTIVTIGMDSDAWLDWMLDELESKDAEKERVGGKHHG